MVKPDHTRIGKHTANTTVLLATEMLVVIGRVCRELRGEYAKDTIQLSVGDMSLHIGGTREHGAGIAWPGCYTPMTSGAE